MDSAILSSDDGPEVEEVDDAPEAEEVDDEPEVEEVDDGPEVEELDDFDEYAPEHSAGLFIDGIEEDDDGAGSGLGMLDGGIGPRVLKRWLLPPSLTPKRPRGTPMPPTVTYDPAACAAADGVWRCTTCSASYEKRIGLFAHARFCAGLLPDWTCEWCGCSESSTSHKGGGPNGPRTLCSACAQRYRHGAEGMPQQNEKGEWVCSLCHRAFPSMSAIGSHRRFCDGGAWRCQWCQCRHTPSTGKGPGPDGPMTLCAACSGRFRAGHTGPPQRNEEGRYMCDRCDRTFDTIPGLGSHRSAPATSSCHHARGGSLAPATCMPPYLRSYSR